MDTIKKIYSIGVAYYPVDDINIETLIKIADQNMYIDKKEKRAIQNN